VDHLSLSFLSAVAGVDVEGESMQLFFDFSSRKHLLLFHYYILKEN